MSDCAGAFPRLREAGGRLQIMDSWRTTSQPTTDVDHRQLKVDVTQLRSGWFFTKIKVNYLLFWILYHYYFVSYSIFNILFFLILFNILFIFLNQSVFNYYNDLIRYNFVYLLFIGYSIFILFP